MNIFVVILAVIGISYLIYILMDYWLLPSRVMQIGPNSMSLSKEFQVITNQQLKTAWTSRSGSTLVFFINPTIADRSGRVDNEYANVVKISSKQYFQILASPDAGRGLYLAPATFTVYQKNPSIPQIDEKEVIEIPNFPLQRWTCIAIVKQGRKFIIYLNGRATVSHMCDKMPDFDSLPLTIGDSRLGGDISFMSLAPYAMSPNEVLTTYKSNVDTSGKPLQPITLSGLFGNFVPYLPSGWWCPGGNCSTPASLSPLEQWKSPY